MCSSQICLFLLESSKKNLIADISQLDQIINLLQVSVLNMAVCEIEPYSRLGCLNKDTSFHINDVEFESIAHAVDYFTFLINGDKQMAGEISWFSGRERNSMLIVNQGRFARNPNTGAIEISLRIAVEMIYLARIGPDYQLMKMLRHQTGTSTITTVAHGELLGCSLLHGKIRTRVIGRNLGVQVLQFIRDFVLIGNTQLLKSGGFGFYIDLAPVECTSQV